MWSTELDLQRTIEMEGCSSDDRSSKKRHVKMWITDAVSLPNVHKMAVSTTKRDIYFYDMSTPAYSPQFHLCGTLLFLVFNWGFKGRCEEEKFEEKHHIHRLTVKIHGTCIYLDIYGITPLQ